jgi:hypothetical protein
MMVDRSEIPLANRLLIEYDNIGQAIDNIDDGGRITSMVIGVGPRANGNATPAQVVTIGMPAPDIMYDTIRASLVDRQREISDQLRDMGVTRG